MENENDIIVATEDVESDVVKDECEGESNGGILSDMDCKREAKNAEKKRRKKLAKQIV